jgi:hypothetical protein
MIEYTTEQDKNNFRIYADVEARMPETLRDLIRVLEWSTSTKTPTGETAAALQRLREMAVLLGHYTRVDGKELI